MSAFLFTLLAVLLASVGARDGATLAAVVQRQGPRPMLAAIAVLVAMATAAAAGWLGAQVLGQLGPVGRGVLAALTLGLAGLEMLLLRPRAAPAEPTASLFAAATVLAALQVTDAARFLVFGIAVGLAAPLPAAAGGALGGALAMLAAASGEARLPGPSIRTARRIVGALLLAAGAVVALGVLDA